MHGKLSVLAVGSLAASVSGCQLVEALLPDGVGQRPAEGLCATYQVMATDEQAVTPEILEQTRPIIEDRVNATGVAEPIVVTQGQDRISVELPGIEDEADMRSLRDLVSTSGDLEFMPVPPELQGTVTEGPLPDAMADIQPLFSGVEIASAVIDQDQTTGTIVVDLELRDTGARLLDEYAAEHFGERFAIVLDGDVVSVPSIDATQFGGRAQIFAGVGGFTPQEANDLVTVLRFGSIPLEVREIAFGACEGSGSSAAETMAQDEDQAADVPVMAGSPSPPPWFGGHVELPEYGFAVTVPDGWVAFDLTTDIASQIEAASDTIDPAVWSISEADLSTWLAGTAAVGMQLWLRPVAGMDLCLVSAPPYDLGSVEDAADSMYKTEVDDPGARDVERPRRIEVAAGPAYVKRLSREDSPGVWWPSAEYWLGTDEVVLLVFCTTDEARPDDDWLSIVETIEFLPAEE